MPDDLLEFVSGPPAYSPIWLWLGLSLLALVAGWFALIFVATMPSQRLRRIPGIRVLHAHMLRHRFARAVRTITRSHRDGDIAAAQAGTALSATLRSFLHQASGTPAQYMQLRAIAASDLAAAAPLLEALGAAQFDAMSTADVGALGDRTEELIRTWN